MSTDIDFSRIKALSFDCYGTIIDWESGILEAVYHETPIDGKTPSETQVLEAFARHETGIQKANPEWLYPKVLNEVGVRIAEDLLDSADANQIGNQLSGSIPEWPAFPDSAESLQNLSRKFELIVLSNISKTAFNATNENHLKIPFSGILTAEEIGSYKPDLKNFRFLIDFLEKRGIGSNEFVHVAQSIYHDIEPAKQLGIKTVWIDRKTGRSGEGATPPPKRNTRADLTFSTLGELANVILS